jgi:protein KRI1
LLDDDDGDGDGAQEEARITVNEAYAKRFVHNKEREDLHRLQELKKKGLANSDGDDDDDDSEEEDEDGLLPVRTDAQIFETLARIKKRDPSIYVSEAKFYDEEGDEDGREEGDGVEPATKEKKKKPLYLKDVVARQLLDGGADEDEEDENLKKKRSKTRAAAAQQPAIATYADEQQELKNAFLQSVAEADSEADDGEILSDSSFTRGFGLF